MPHSHKNIYEDSTKFALASEGLDPLDFSKLPVYLPAEEPPQLYP